MSDGERIRIPMDAIDAAAFGPPPGPERETQEKSAEPAEPSNVRAQVLRELFGDRIAAAAADPGAIATTEEEAQANSLAELEAQGKIPPVRKFEEAPDYEERRAAAMAAAQAAPPIPIDQGPDAYLPVGGDAIDVKTAESLGILGPVEPADSPDVYEKDEDVPLKVEVSVEYLAALREVFDSIEAIPVEGADMTVEEFNKAMDRQAAAREAVRKILRG